MISRLALIIAPLVVVTSTAAPASATGNGSGTVSKDQAAPVAAKSQKSRVQVRAKAPKFLAVNVTLKRSGTRKHYVIGKPAGRKRVKRTVVVKPGKYRVVASSAIEDGTLFLPKVSRRSFRVGKGKRAGVAVNYRRVPVARNLGLTSLGATAVSLKMKIPRGIRVKLRRTVGTKPVGSVKRGVAVGVNKNGRAKSKGLTPSSTYTYTLFSKLSKSHRWRKKFGLRKSQKWSPPIHLTAGTSPPRRQAGKPSGAPVPAAYVPAVDTLMLQPESTKRIAVRDGRLELTLATKTVAPVLGAGVVLPISRELPNGFLGRVVSVSKTGRVITIEPAGLGDAFDYYHLNTGRIASGPKSLAANGPPGPSVDTSQKDRSRWQDQDAEVAATTVGLKCSPGLARGTTLNPSIDLNGHFDWTVNKFRGWGPVPSVPKSADLNMSIEATVTASVNLDTEIGGTCELDLPEVTYPLSVVPVPMSFKMGPTVKASLKGVMEVGNVGISATAGFDLDVHISPLPGSTKVVGGPYFNARPLTPKIAELGGVLDFKLGGNVSVGPGSATELAGAIAGVEGSLYPLHARIQNRYPANDPRFHKCLKADVGISAELALIAEAWVGSWKVGGSLSADWLKVHKAYAELNLPAGCEKPPEHQWSGTVSVNQKHDYGDPSEQGNGQRKVEATAKFSDLRVVDYEVDTKNTSDASDDETIYHMAAGDFSLDYKAEVFKLWTVCTPGVHLVGRYERHVRGDTQELWWSMGRGNGVAFDLILDADDRLRYDPAYPDSNTEGTSRGACEPTKWVPHARGFTTLEYAPGQVFVTRADAYLTDKNPAATRFTGVTAYTAEKHAMRQSDWDGWVRNHGPLNSYEYTVDIDLTRGGN